MRLSRDPLLHFVVLATLLFAANYFWSANRKERITVDRQTVEFLITQREDLLLRELMPGEVREVIGTYIEEEILYREAYKRGLDRVDARARRDMIRRMRDLLGGNDDLPTEDQLRAYFSANAERYARPARFSLDHIFYDDRGDVPDGVLEALRSGANPEGLGQTLDWYGVTTPLFSSRELGGLFGPDAARRILAIDDTVWHGPFDFSRGVVLVRIADRQPAASVLFEDVRRYVLEDWLNAMSRSAIEDEVRRFAGEYDVRVEAEGLYP